MGKRFVWTGGKNLVIWLSMKRTTPQRLFDSDRQKSEGVPRPSGIDETLYRDEEDAKRAESERSAANHRKAVYAHIKAHPGVTENSVRVAVGSASGVKEWLRDGIIVRRQGGLYVV